MKVVAVKSRVTTGIIGVHIENTRRRSKITLSRLSGKAIRRSKDIVVKQMNKLPIKLDTK